jgi:hypothetical protein
MAAFVSSSYVPLPVPPLTVSVYSLTKLALIVALEFKVTVVLALSVLAIIALPFTNVQLTNLYPGAGVVADMADILITAPESCPNPLAGLNVPPNVGLLVIVRM